MVNKSESRAGTPITLVIIHTNEGNHSPGLTPDHTAEDLAAYLDRANAANDWKSYHLICDDDSTVRYVADSEASWSALAANLRSLNLCFTGWAHWTPADWATHDPMLRRGATEVANWCRVHNIPASKLAPVQVGANMPGCCGHWDWTLGKVNGNHTDPGPGFPWDLFMRYVSGGAASSPTEDKAMVTPGIPLAGVGRKIIAIPTGTADGYSGRKVTVSITSLAAGHVEVYAQSDTAGTDQWVWTDADFTPSKENNYARRYRELPSGTTKLIVGHNFPTADASLTFEILATR